LSIHQDTDVSVARLSKGQTLDYGFADGRSGWVQLIDGSLDVNGVKIEAGDGAAISGEEKLRLESADRTDGAHFLFFDLK
jgi:redox-sensitive bicupin YhaK (pirin superfamily)